MRWCMAALLTLRQSVLGPTFQTLVLRLTCENHLSGIVFLKMDQCSHGGGWVCLCVLVCGVCVGVCVFVCSLCGGVCWFLCLVCVFCCLFVLVFLCVCVCGCVCVCVSVCVCA